jgi:rare lipoprotein A
MILRSILNAAVILFGVPTPAPVSLTASYYADHYEGKMMANGRPFRQSKLTCASNDWPLGTRLRVQYGPRHVEVMVTDRMHPRFAGRRIDLSKAAFRMLSLLQPGIIPVSVTRLP